MDTNLSIKRWQDWGNLLLGAWLFISPWVMQFAYDMPNVAVNAHVLGAAIVILAAIAVYMPRMWEEALNVVLGLWAIISPWALGFAGNRNVMMNFVIVGVLVTALAAWAIARDRSFAKSEVEHRTASGR